LRLLLQYPFLIGQLIYSSKSFKHKELFCPVVTWHATCFLYQQRCEVEGHVQAWRANISFYEVGAFPMKVACPPKKKDGEHENG
jgi:hypothetical protein